MDNKAKFVLLEGVDLSGKSSVVKHLVQKQPDWRHQHYSLVGENQILSIARDIDKDGSEWIGFMYAKALERDLEHFEWPRYNTIQDSTILLRSLAYHSAAGYSRVTSELESLAQKHPRFSYAYVFTASMEVRRERLEERIRSGSKRVTANDLKVIQDPNFFARMEDALVDYAKNLFGAVVIDTSRLSVEEVAGCVVVE